MCSHHFCTPICRAINGALPVAVPEHGQVVNRKSSTASLNRLATDEEEKMNHQSTTTNNPTTIAEGTRVHVRGSFVEALKLRSRGRRPRSRRRRVRWMHLLTFCNVVATRCGARFDFQAFQRTKTFDRDLPDITRLTPGDAFEFDAQVGACGNLIRVTAVTRSLFQPKRHPGYNLTNDLELIGDASA
jgi:hypothetical protein